MTITAYITSGGSSSRFKEDKSLFLYRGKPLIQHVYDRLNGLFPKVYVIANDAAKYFFLNAEIIPDVVEGFGPKGGLYTALVHAQTEGIFFCGCDMPNISAGLVRYLLELAPGYDVVVPVVPKGYDPLHAVYAKRCLAFVKDSVESGRRKITAFYPQVRVRGVTVEEMQRFGNWEEMLFNINYKHEAAH
jgi:molybdopterin-guanine dinucleotide biosynthesis protein A